MSDPAPSSRVIRMGAEFLVIVVGVLVALAVDEWSSSVEERELESQYLEALAADLRIDSAVYAAALVPNVERALDALGAILPVSRGVAPIPSDTAGFIQLAWFSQFSVAQFEDQRTTFEELLATGNLSLIRSAEVRASIVAYYEQARLSTRRSESRQTEYAQLLRGYLPPPGEELNNPAERRRVFDDVIQLVRSEEFLREANRQRLWLNFQLRQMSDLQELLHPLQERLAQDHP